MFKKILLIIIILSFTIYGYAEWKFNPHTGKLDYYEPAGAGSGDVTSVGDCASGACFDGNLGQGTWIKFYDAQGAGQLITGNLTAARVWTLPDATGTVLLGVDIDTFAELDAIVADKALVNKADGAVWLGVHDFGGATSVEIPNGAPTVDTTGEIGIDTTDDQLLYMGGTVQRILTYKQQKCFALETPVAADDNVPIFFPTDAITVTAMSCMCEGGTSAEVILSDGTNALDTMTCDADGAVDDGGIANATFTANEEMQFDIGTVTGTVTWVTMCFTYTTTAE